MQLRDRHERAVQGHERPLLGAGGGQDVVQVGCHVGDDVDRLVQVPVGRRQRDARVPSEQAHAGRVLEPAQHEQCLGARGRGALPGTDVAGAAMSRDPSGHDRQGVGGHVEGGTISDQAGSQSSSLRVWRLASWSSDPASTELTTERTCRSARRRADHITAPGENSSQCRGSKSRTGPFYTKVSRRRSISGVAGLFRAAVVK